MEKINQKLIPLFLLIQPILDIFVVLFPNFLISTIVRGLFLSYIIITLLISTKTRKITIITILLMFLYFLYNYLSLQQSLMQNCTMIFKFFYLPFTIIFCSTIKIDNISKYLYIILLEYISIYLISYIFHIGQDIYETSIGKEGYKGLFYSINEFSAILVILYYNSFSYLKEKKLLLLLLTSAILIVACLTGTKVLLGGILLVILIYILPIFTKKWKSSSILFKILMIAGILLIASVGFLAFMQTNAYQNMIVQANFFKISDIFSFDGINKVLFNDRLSFLIKNQNYFLKQKLLTMCMGIGYFHPLKLVEIDLFDIIYRYGLLGFIIEVVTFIYLFKNLDKDKELIIATIILIIISLTSGHVLLSPNVSIYFGTILLLKKSAISL